MAFYLKYRPQTIFQLDIASVRDGLYGILGSSELPHALLFTGPRGTGKTSSARILAKAVNCEQRNEKIEKSKENKKSSSKIKTNIEPCNECSNCKTISSGQSLDIIEIDAASHRGIDDIRDLREKIKLVSTGLQYKIYIIDEVHMLTTEAFNALLKTLEEPPANVLFVLCTTELHKLPQTIVSRCIKINFNKASITDIVHSLNRVIKGEKIEIDKSSVQIIAQQADGSFRDAHKMLEQLSWAGKTITSEQIKKLVGISEAKTEEIIAFLNKKDITNCIKLIEKITTEGQNLRIIFQSVLENLHLELLARHGVGEPVENAKLEAFDLQILISKLNRALFKMKTSVIEQLPIELAIIEWGTKNSQNNRTSTIPLQSDTIQKKINNNFDSGSQPVQTIPSPSLHQNNSQVDFKNPTSSENFSPSNNQTNTNEAIQNSKAKTTLPSTAPITLENLQQRWNDLLQAVKPKNHSIQALLRSARPKAINGDQINIEVWYPFHLDKLSSHTNRQIVEQTICDLFGCSTVRLEYILGQKGDTPASLSHQTFNGNMMPESQAQYTRTPKPAVQVSDHPSQKYTHKPKRSNTSGTEDEALIKFAEEIFGG